MRYSTTGCGGPIHKRKQRNGFADHNSYNGSDIHNKNRPSHAVVVVHFNDAIFYSAIRHVGCHQSRYLDTSRNYSKKLSPKNCNVIFDCRRGLI